MADFNEFFPSPENGNPTPDGGSAPSPPPASPSEADILRQQLQFQNQLLAQAMRPQPPPTQEAPQVPAFPQWTDKEFLGADDARMILDAPGEQFPQRLNRVVNSAVREVHDSLAQQIQRRDEENARLRADLDARFQAQEAQRSSEYWNNTFYSAHQDLRDDPDLVREATLAVAHAVAQQPWQQRSAQDTLNAIAQQARAIRQQKLARWTGGEGTPSVPAMSAPSPGRRAAVESGGSTRVGVARDANPDAQKKALNDMIAHVRGGR